MLFRSVSQSRYEEVRWDVAVVGLWMGLRMRRALLVVFEEGFAPERRKEDQMSVASSWELARSRRSRMPG